jgi:hypothetical protein
MHSAHRIIAERCAGFGKLDMNSKLASGVLTALIYVQVVLCFAGAATVLLRDRVSAQNVAAETVVPADAVRL